MAVSLQKNDKWTKMASVDENMAVLVDFLEKAESKILVIYVNQQSQLTPINAFPSSTKQKVHIHFSTSSCFLLYRIVK